MAQKSEQQAAVVTPSPNKPKTSIWKRRLGKKSGKKSSSKKSADTATAMRSPKAVEHMVTITINNGTTSTVPAAISKEEIVVESLTGWEGRSGGLGFPETTTSSNNNYTMEDILQFPSTSAATTRSSQASSSNNSAASYFGSIISRRNLSFSEEELSNNNEGNGNDGLIIQEVASLFGAEPFLHVVNSVVEEWTPFGTDASQVIGLSRTPSPQRQSNEVVVITNRHQPSPKKNQQSSHPEEAALFKVVKKVDGGSSSSISISSDKLFSSSPLAEPPSTQRKTLTPEFFIGSGANNRNNTRNTTTSPNSQKQQRKRLSNSKRHDDKGFNASFTASNCYTSASPTNNDKKENNNKNNFSSNMSSASSSQGGQVYAEIYLQTKPKKKHPSVLPPPSRMMGVRDRSTLSAHSIPSLAMTAVSSLSGHSSMFGTVQAEEHACCGENPMPVTPEGIAQEYGNDDTASNKNTTTTTTEYNYFDYDANIEAPLSPQGVSPERPGKSTTTTPFLQNISRKSHWKTTVNKLWSNVSKHTCRCLGDPFSSEDGESGEKWKKLSSGATTAATSIYTSTTGAVTANSTAAQAHVRKMNRSPLFSSPVAEPV